MTNYSVSRARPVGSTTKCQNRHDPDTPPQCHVERSETSLTSPLGQRASEIVRDGKPGLARSAHCVTASPAAGGIRMTNFGIGNGGMSPSSRGCEIWLYFSGRSALQRASANPRATCRHSARLGFLPICGLAGSATWKSNPVDSDWNNASNWKPATVPNGPNDRATFNFQYNGCVAPGRCDRAR